MGFLDPFENPGSAQFHHRHLGLISLIAIGIFFVKNLYKKKLRVSFTKFIRGERNRLRLVRESKGLLRKDS